MRHLIIGGPRHGQQLDLTKKSPMVHLLDIPVKEDSYGLLPSSTTYLRSEVYVKTASEDNSYKYAHVVVYYRHDALSLDESVNLLKELIFKEWVIFNAQETHTEYDIERRPLK